MPVREYGKEKEQVVKKRLLSWVSANVERNDDIKASAVVHKDVWCEVLGRKEKKNIQNFVVRASEVLNSKASGNVEERRANLLYIHSP